MTEPATTVGSLLLPLATLVLGGALTLVGQWVGPSLQRQTSKEEAARLHRQAMAEKAEQLFDEIERVRARARSEVLLGSAPTEGEADKNYYYTTGELGRLRALIYIHFPKLRILVHSYDVEMGDLAAKIFNRDTASEPAEPMDQLRKYARDSYPVTYKFLANLEVAIAEQVAQLPVK